MSRFESGQLAKDRKTAEKQLELSPGKAILALLQQPNMDAAAASACVTPRDTQTVDAPEGIFLSVQT